MSVVVVAESDKNYRDPDRRQKSEFMMRKREEKERMSDKRKKATWRACLIN